jgi:hypothetical protein
MAITGTPGIGKSMFLFYILWRLANMEATKTVVLRRRMNHENIFVFQNDGCWKTENPGNIGAFLSNPTTWYLADALEPPPDQVNAVTILVSSPAQKYYSKFLTFVPVPPLHYLPFWSLEELELVAPFYSRDSKDVKKRFAMIGGIARFVLEKNDELEGLIDESVEKLKISKLISIALGEVSREVEIGHRILHFEVKPPFYTKRTLVMASVYVLERASLRFLQFAGEDVKYFLFWSTGIPSLATFRGFVFEGYAHQKLSAGGDFLVRNLDNDTTLTLALTQ